MNTLSLLSGILFVIGFVPYTYAVLRDRNMPSGTLGKTEPSKATWIIWISLDMITLAGMVAKHTVNFQIIGCVTGGTLVMLLSIRYGIPGWTKLDKLCLSGAVLGLALWAISRNPMVGMATSLSVTFLGSIPTFVSTWEDYHRESKVGWTIFFISCCLAVIAVPKFDMATAAQPLTFFTIETIMMLILFVKPRLCKVI